MTQYRYPHITGSAQEQLQQLKNYLYQLVEQLNNTPAETLRAVPGVTVPVTKEKTPAQTFAELKGLIIKSADIVEAYADRIEKRLQGSYVARSEYGDFVRQTENTITATDTRIQQDLTHLEQVVTGLQTLQNQTSGYIRTGLLYYAGQTDPLPEGTPVYGVEVGQESGGQFHRFGRFTAYGLTFYDENGTPAATISQGKLKIPQAWVTVNFTEGGFTDDIRPDGTIITRWQGI